MPLRQALLPVSAFFTVQQACSALLGQFVHIGGGNFHRILFERAVGLEACPGALLLILRSDSVFGARLEGVLFYPESSGSPADGCALASRMALECKRGLFFSLPLRQLPQGLGLGTRRARMNLQCAYGRFAAQAIHKHLPVVPKHAYLVSIKIGIYGIKVFGIWRTHCIWTWRQGHASKNTLARVIIR